MERDDGGTAGSGNENMHANPGRTYTLTENNLNMHDFSEAATWNVNFSEMLGNWGEASMNFKPSFWAGYVIPRDQAAVLRPRERLVHCGKHKYMCVCMCREIWAGEGGKLPFQWK